MAEHICFTSGILFRAFVLLALMIVSTASAADEPSKESKVNNHVQPAIKLDNSVDSLAVLQQSIATKRDLVRGLNEELKQKTEASERLELEQKIARINNERSR